MALMGTRSGLKETTTTTLMGTRCSFKEVSATALLGTRHGNGDVAENSQGVERHMNVLHPQERTRKVSCKGISFEKAGAQRQPWADLFFNLYCIKNEGHTTVVLGLNQMDFGIKNSCNRNCSVLKRPCDSKCISVFIHKIVIQVSPRSWAGEDCHKVVLKPRLNSGVFGLQRSSTFGIHTPILNANRASLTYKTSNTISSTASAFQMAPASSDDSANSVTWPWEQSRFADGSKLDFNRSRWRSRPQLGIYVQHLLPENWHSHG